LDEKQRGDGANGEAICLKTSTGKGWEKWARRHGHGAGLRKDGGA